MLIFAPVLDKNIVIANEAKPNAAIYKNSASVDVFCGSPRCARDDRARSEL